MVLAGRSGPRSASRRLPGLDLGAVDFITKPIDPATAGKRGGSGIGTYSARLLVQAQHGDIGLEVSDAQNWTRVSVTLPRWGHRP